MKYVLLAALLGFGLGAQAQTPAFEPRPIALPAELADRNNQFSGLCLYRDKLLLLSESRLQDPVPGEPKIYALPLAELDKRLAQPTAAPTGKKKKSAPAPAPLPYQKLRLVNLEQLRARMDKEAPAYEGLEALTVVGETAYLTVETHDDRPYCYLLKGRIDEAAGTVVLDPEYLMPIVRPLTTKGEFIHNAGFEALTTYQNRLLMIFEYNYFSPENYIREVEDAPAKHNALRYVPTDTIPFRITDVTPVAPGRYTAINFFYKGDEDSVYRVPADARLIQQAPQGFHSYARLLSLSYDGQRLRWQPLFDLPAPYQEHNWEGIEYYKEGYFLINDKYGPGNQSTLLYLRKQ